MKIAVDKVLKIIDCCPLCQSSLEHISTTRKYATNEWRCSSDNNHFYISYDRDKDVDIIECYRMNDSGGIVLIYVQDDYLYVSWGNGRIPLVNLSFWLDLIKDKVKLKDYIDKLTLLS